MALGRKVLVFSGKQKPNYMKVSRKLGLANSAGQGTSQGSGRECGKAKRSNLYVVSPGGRTDSGEFLKETPNLKR